MNWTQLLTDIAAIIAVSAPLIIATMGIYLSERAGVINLSVDGSMLLAGMAGFAVAYTTNSLILGFVAAALVGGDARPRHSGAACSYISSAELATWLNMRARRCNPWP